MKLGLGLSLSKTINFGSGEAPVEPEILVYGDATNSIFNQNYVQSTSFGLLNQSGTNFTDVSGWSIYKYKFTFFGVDTWYVIAPIFYFNSYYYYVFAGCTDPDLWVSSTGRTGSEDSEYISIPETIGTRGRPDLSEKPNSYYIP